MANTVRGSARKGKRLTHTPKAHPSSAPNEKPVPGGSAGGGMGKGGENARGNAGNAGLSGTP